VSRHEVVSPIPGVFYRRPDPDSDVYAKEGQTIGADDTVCLVEVMKSFHPVQAGAAGTLVETGRERSADRVFEARAQHPARLGIRTHARNAPDQPRELRQPPVPQEIGEQQRREPEYLIAALTVDEDVNAVVAGAAQQRGPGEPVRRRGRETEARDVPGRRLQRASSPEVERDEGQAQRLSEHPDARGLVHLRALRKEAGVGGRGAVALVSRRQGRDGS